MFIEDNFNRMNDLREI